MSTTTEGEAWRALAHRGPGALLRWGTFIIQPEWHSLAGGPLVWENGPAPAETELLSASNGVDAPYHQRLQHRVIPFPRVPKDGFLMRADESLRLEVSSKLIEPHSTTLENDSVLGSDSANPLYVLPFFRIMLSHGAS